MHLYPYPLACQSTATKGGKSKWVQLALCFTKAWCFYPATPEESKIWSPNPHSLSAQDTEKGQYNAYDIGAAHKHILFK